MTTFVWSVDDAGSGGGEMVQAMQQLCRFLEDRDQRATWFVVPQWRGEALSAEWTGALIEARDAGHDLQLHGLTHEDCYEYGPPAWPATYISPNFQPDFERRRQELLPRYTVERLQARIEEGIAVFRETLGVDPLLFRAPCGAISRPMFEALKNVGIRYHSVMYLSATGYAHLPHNSGDLTPQWTDEIPHRPFRWYSDVVEVPILNEYTWRGAGQRSAEFIEMARQDASRIAEESPIAVILMHTHGIADDMDHAFRVVDALIEHVGAQHNFSTLGELACAGAIDAAATVTGPDLLAI